MLFCWSNYETKKYIGIIEAMIDIDGLPPRKRQDIPDDHYYHWPSRFCQWTVIRVTDSADY